MKTKILISVFLFTILAVSVCAKNKEKGILIEANVSYTDIDNKNFATITPAVAYQFDSRWIAGVKVGFETREQSFLIYTPFVRFSFLEISKLSMFTEAKFNVYERKVDGGQSGYYETGLSFGVVYNLTRHINLTGHYLFLGYSNKVSKKGAWVGDEFGVDANINRLHVGLQVVF